MTQPASAKTLHPRLYLGTSSWSSKDWEGVFYPPGTGPSAYLAHYATRFRSAEVDATFYRIPSTVLVKKWRRDLPEGFLLAAKVPQVITHEKAMVGCEDDLKAFIGAMDDLGDRLGPLLFQFPYYRKGSEMTEAAFLGRLTRLLPSLPKGHRFALEVRNKSWLKPGLLDILREHRVALALIDHPWMPTADGYFEGQDPVTADFCYVRWLGDRYGIEEKTKTWSKIVVDRTRETNLWVSRVRDLLDRGLTVFGYYNNHYAGHAPGSVDLFERVWSGEA